MKKWILYLSVLILFICCKKSFTDVPALDFEVTVDSPAYEVNQPITFNFTGNSDIVTFYSGADGSEYRYKGRTSVEGGTPQLRFNSLRQYGAQNGIPDNTLAIYASTDFNNVFDVASLKRATWIDLTAQAELSTAISPDMTFTPSGTIDLSGIDAGEAPVFIAFKYHDVPSAVSQRAWTIRDLSVDNVIPDGSVINLANSANMSWGIINVLNAERIWTFTTAQIVIWGGAVGLDENEDWIISRPIFLNRVPRDKGISIKSNPTAVLTSYTFPGYSQPGTYVVTFEVINANRWDNKQILKELTITVK